MGQDKALMPFLGEPLILRPVQRLSRVTDQILVITNSPEKFGFLDLPLFTDAMPGMGALGGLYTALSAAGADLVANVGCDMPFVSVPVLREEYRLLIEDPNLAFVIPRSENGLEPMHAIYRKSLCLPAVRESLERGERRMISWHEYVQSALFLEVGKIRRFDPGGLAFINLNTPEEFRQAEGLAAGEEGRS
jgi:molybdopterin-guanine dinucleotide biosynthesis protein A